MVFIQVVQYVEGNGLLHPSHHGSRGKHSTRTALIEMYDIWVESAETVEMAGVMMLDLSAAFDLVDHHLLLQKLELLGFEQNSVIWMWNYLSGRSQCVYVDGKLSNFKPVTIGVLQGTVLGALKYMLAGHILGQITQHHINKFLST